jgi:hypothetical protein
MNIIKSLDYVGFVLFSGSLASMLLGVSWGGQRYRKVFLSCSFCSQDANKLSAWKSAEVITTIVVGGVGMFVLAAYGKQEPPYFSTNLYLQLPREACQDSESFGAYVNHIESKLCQPYDYFKCWSNDLLCSQCTVAAANCSFIQFIT